MQSFQSKIPNLPVKEIKAESQKIGQKIKHQMYSYVVAALGLVAGLAWNEAIKFAIDYLFPISKNTILAKFLYASLMTLVAVVFTLYLARILKEEDVGK
jgi:hypothetical protein